jgi:Flp pilus assembly protein TadG
MIMFAGVCKIFNRPRAGGLSIQYDRKATYNKSMESVSILELITSGNDGGSLVEFALSLPLMMMLITGMFTFGLSVNNYMVLTTGVGGAARALALSRGQTSPALAASDPCQFAVNVGQASATTIQGGITWQIIWTTTNSSGSQVSTTYSNSCAGLALNSGDTVQVKGTHPYSIQMYGWLPQSFNMSAQTSELVQ